MCSIFNILIQRLNKLAAICKIAIRIKTIRLISFDRILCAEYAVSDNYPTIAGNNDLIHYARRKQAV